MSESGSRREVIGVEGKGVGGGGEREGDREKREEEKEQGSVVEELQWRLPLSSSFLTRFLLSLPPLLVSFNSMLLNKSHLLEPARVVELAVAAKRGIAACLREHFRCCRCRPSPRRSKLKGVKSRKEKKVKLAPSTSLVSPCLNGRAGKEKEN